MKKATGHMGFAEMAVAHRKRSNLFLERVQELLNWTELERVIARYDTRGKAIAGNTAYPGLVLFKMSLLGIWYKLRDRALEERVNDSLSFTRFVGLSLSDSVPDHSVISRFRTLLTHTGGWDALLQSVNDQIRTHGLLLHTGTLIDASITQSPRKPQGKPLYEVEDTASSEAPVEGEKGITGHRGYAPRVDTEASWTKKAGKCYWGYKKHHATDLNGMILAVETTPAHVHDNKAFEALVDRANPPTGSRCYADKGYVGSQRNSYLKAKQLKNGIQQKAVRNRALTARQKQRNKLISKVRYAVERTFGGQKRWFGAGSTRYLGLAATHTQHVWEAICYNLKRAPQLYLNQLAKKALEAELCL